MSRHLRRYHGALLGLLLSSGFAVAAHAADAPAHTFKMHTPGFSSTGVSFGAGDAIDPMSGEVNLSSTDVQVPGKNGLDVALVRSYSSKEFFLRSHMPHVPIVDSPVGLGWTLMAGPELLDAVMKDDPRDIQVRLPGGAIMQMYPMAKEGEEGDNRFWSINHWILVYNSWDAPEQMTLYSPDGLAYEYRVDVYRQENWYFDGGSTVVANNIHLPVSQWDTHGNTVCFTYAEPGTHKTRLVEITDSYRRKITLSYTDEITAPDQAPQLTSVSFGDRIITYTVARAPWGIFRDQFNQLQAVNNGDFAVTYKYNEPTFVPPACAKSALGGCPWLLTTLQWPTGAMTNYTYQPYLVATRFDPSTGWSAFATDVCTIKKTSGPGVGPRVIKYAYNPTSQDQTIITDPEGNDTVYGYHPYKTADPADPRGPAPIGAISEVRRYQGSTDTGTLLQTSQSESDYKIVGLVPAPPGSDALFSGLLNRRDLKEERTYYGTADPGDLVHRSTALSWDAYGNVLTTEETGYKAPPRTTTLTYKVCDSLLNTDPTTQCDTRLKRAFPYLLHVVHGLVTSKTVSGAPEDYVEFSDINDLTEVTERRVLDHAPDSSDRTQQATFTYDADGQLHTSTTWDGAAPVNTTTYAYSNTPTATTVTVQDTIDVSLGTRQQAAYRMDGLMAAATDRNGHTTTYEYTAGGLLRKINFPKGPPAQAIDYTNCWRASGPPQITASRTPNTTTYTYNSLLELLKTQTAADGKTITTVQDRDLLGRAFRAALPTYADPLTADTAEAYTTTSFDGVGRPVEQRLHATDGRPDQVATMKYPRVGVTVSTDPKKQLTTTEADGFGRLRAITTPDGTTTTYTYNHLNALTGVFQPGVAPRSFTYSRAGLLDEEFLPESGFTTHTYDRLGRATGRAQEGLTISTLYDSRGRPLRMSFPDPGRPDTVFTYDRATWCLANCYDRLVSTDSEADSTHILGYDVHGNLLSKEVTLLNPTTRAGDLMYRVGYTYDALDRLETIAYPSGRTVKHSYDNANRLQTVEQKAIGDPDFITLMAAPMSYVASGALETLRLTSGVTQSFAYDPRMRPQNITVTGPTESYLKLAYEEYDPNNNLKAQTITPRAKTPQRRTFGYDEMDRLTNAGLPEGALTYRYDAPGNRYALDSGVAAVPAYRLTLAPWTNRFADWSYDARGNVIEDGKHIYTYTSDNRLRTVDGGKATYYYDSNGQRVRKELEDGTVYLYYREGTEAITTWKKKTP